MRSCTSVSTGKFGIFKHHGDPQFPQVYGAPVLEA